MIHENFEKEDRRKRFERRRTRVHVRDEEDSYPKRKEPYKRERVNYDEFDDEFLEWNNNGD